MTTMRCGAVKKAAEKPSDHLVAAIWEYENRAVGNGQESSLLSANGGKIGVVANWRIEFMHSSLRDNVDTRKGGRR